MRKFASIVLNGDAEKFTFVLTWVTVASYNVSVFAMNVVYYSSQIVLVNSIFCH